MKLSDRSRMQVREFVRSADKSLLPVCYKNNLHVICKRVLQLIGNLNLIPPKGAEIRYRGYFWAIISVFVNS